jgi:Ca2+-transporting ATPase
MTEKNNWRELNLGEIEKRLGTDLKSGLSHLEAEARLASRGPNELPAPKPESLWVIFLRQFQSALIYILLIAAAIIFALGETVDGFLILAVLTFNAVIGTVQEGKAQNTLRALRSFAETTAVVLREGREVILPDKNVVLGDVILLREGEKVPADALVLESRTLKADEAALTGESKPVYKKEKDLVFKGTAIVNGNGRAVVIKTGLETEIGKISRAIAGIDTEIPLKRDVRYLARFIIFGVGIISAVLFFFGLYLGKDFREMFAVTVSLAVSVVPEGLPVVLTLILARGVWRMAKRNALVKKLQAVEALGQAQIIAVDKTGTLTRNEMVIRKVFADGKFFEVGGVGYEPKGEIELEGKPIAPPNHPELLLAGKIAAMCANARVSFWEETKTWKVYGDPTEAALLVFGAKVGFVKDELERETPQITEIPFDYETKYHLVAHRISDKRQLVTVAGAPEKVLPLCSKIYSQGKAAAMSKSKREEIENVFHKLSRQGLRVVAAAYREEALTPSGESIKIGELVFLGFYGMEDSLRPEVPEAMARAKEAGIKVVMITGDARLTAVAIAKEAGIYQDGDEVLTDADIENLSGADLDEKIINASVFARITPEHKMKIIEAYRRKGKVVAMTGDGVNDAPSLVAADLGVAMGKIGTEVAKEAADIVLLDDNFGSIVSAVEEGRSMYRAIQKVILFLFSTSLGEVLAIAGAMFAGLPLPLLAPQILWMNLVTDSFVAFGLALDNKRDEDLLWGEFRRPNRYLITKTMVLRMMVMSLPMMLGGIYLFRTFYETDIVKAWTMTLTALVAFQWLNGWNCLSERRSIFSENPFRNVYLSAFVGAAVLLQVAALETPLIRDVLRLTPLTLGEWGLALGVAASIIVVEELRKALRQSLFGNRSRSS